MWRKEKTLALLLGQNGEEPYRPGLAQMNGEIRWKKNS